MRLVITLWTVSFLSLGASQAFAWDRDTVAREIEKLCEERNPDDWPGQEFCIRKQREGLTSIRPPRGGDAEFDAAYESCKTSAESAYDFDFISTCYDFKAAPIASKRKVAAAQKQAGEFITEYDGSPVIVQCSFVSGRKLEIRRREKLADAILVKFGNDPLVAGRSGVGYSYWWGNPTGVDSRLDGNQLRDGGSHPATLFVGSCDYR